MANTHERLDIGDNVTELFNICCEIGRIVEVSADEDTATVQLGGYGTLDAVPIFYHCEAATDTTGGRMAFQPDDDVLVMVYDARDPGSVKSFEIVGFPDEPRPCRREIALIVGMAVYGDGTYRALCAAWDIQRDAPYFPPGYETDEDGWWCWDAGLSVALPIIDSIVGWFAYSWSALQPYLAGHIWERLSQYECVSQSLYSDATLQAGTPADLQSPPRAFAAGVASPVHDIEIGGKSIGIVGGDPKAVASPFAISALTPLRVDQDELGFSDTYVDVPIFHPEDLEDQPYRRPFGGSGWNGSEPCYLPDGYEMELDPQQYYCVSSRDQYTLRGAYSEHAIVAAHVVSSTQRTGPNLAGAGLVMCHQRGITAVTHYGPAVLGIDPAALAPGNLSEYLWSLPDLVAIKHVGIYDLAQPKEVTP